MKENREWTPRILCLLCRWCAYAGADLAGISRIHYPPTPRVIRFPCSARMDPYFVIKGFREGFDGVLVAGCHPGDCHYSKGNYYARRRFMLLKDLLLFAGIEPERLQIRWISAAEGKKFAQVISEMTEKILPLGPLKIKEISLKRILEKEELWQPLAGSE
ncbi:hydrogenase iron-sulfur subunit [bacterium]|nr:hydrogenase iron-sulfur subunit [bacterium]